MKIRARHILVPAAGMAVAVGIAVMMKPVPPPAPPPASASFELRRTAETYCAACHVPMGDWRAAVPPALFADHGALRAHLLDAAAYDMPPSDWNRRQLAAILGDGA